MQREVVITGIGLQTPLGSSARGVLAALEDGQAAACEPSFDTSHLWCKRAALVREFVPEEHVEDAKSLRLMSRDAQLAVAAARAALADAQLRPGRTYPCEQIALYGATGLTGMPAEEVTALVRHSADAGGQLDLRQFGQVALKRVRPVLSFKILANMPICFVSIFTNLQGENAVYAPWEGQGAHAIAAGIAAIKEGWTNCAVVGGCDVRTHEFAFVSLQQLGAFDSWRKHGSGSIPAEGAAFLVLEEEQAARTRGASPYARLTGHATLARTSAAAADDIACVLARASAEKADAVMAAGDGDLELARAEFDALDRLSLQTRPRLQPKAALGNLYAAAAAVQMALAAARASLGGLGHRVAANCVGHGSQCGAFLLEGL